VTTTLQQRSVRQKSEPWVAPVGRVGVASQGVLYAVVGILALQVASGHETDRADQHGALYAVSSQPFGRALLLVLTVGLAAHCVWRLLLFVRGDVGSDDAKDWAKRLGQLGRAFIYAVFTWAAIKELLDAGGGSQGASREGVARALDWPGGPVLVAIVGGVVLATGVWHMSKLITRRYEKDLDLDGRPEGFQVWVRVLGAVGYFGRGVGFALVGWFFVYAAFDHDPNEAGGLDNALKQLVRSEHGAGMLRLVAIGLFAFGIYRVIDAFVRRHAALANA